LVGIDTEGVGELWYCANCFEQHKIPLDCTNCQGWCCRQPFIILNLSADDDPSKYKCARELEDRSEGGSGFGDYLLNRNPVTGACVYFDGYNNNCSIYDRRPLTCQRWDCRSYLVGHCRDSESSEVKAVHERARKAIWRVAYPGTEFKFGHFAKTMGG
jgi:Fe-S-cluster containining protein